VEDDDAVGLREDRLEVGVQVVGRLPPLPRLEERPHHVALHRPGPEQRDVDDEVLEGLRRELPDQLALPGDSIWKQPSVLVDCTSAKVAGSSRGAASTSTGAPSTRATSATACCIADCIGCRARRA
jgi:hypothetical protein